MLMMVLAHRPSPCHPTQHSATVMRYTRRNYILCQTQNTILTCFSAKQAFMDWHVWLISTKMSFFFGSVHFHIVWPRGQCLPFNLIFFFWLRFRNIVFRFSLYNVYDIVSSMLSALSSTCCIRFVHIHNFRRTEIRSQIIWIHYQLM